MLVAKAYKFRIYPNKAQQEMIEQTFKACRWVYNHYLDLHEKMYEAGQKPMSVYTACKDLTEVKKQEKMQWLVDSDSQALQQTLRHLDSAYKNFFRKVKKGEKGHPRFKSRYDSHQSYTTPAFHGKKVFLSENGIKLPRCGVVKMGDCQEIKGTMMSATISRTSANKYYVSLCCVDVEAEPLPKTNNQVGVDLGVKDLAITSDGQKYKNNKYLYKADKRLKRLQRQLAKKEKGSNNFRKQKEKIARLYDRISNQRNDALHKATRDIINNNDVICIETLNVQGMMKNHHLARAISDASMSEFSRQLTYKADWAGRELRKVSTWFPSSQTCSVCGAVNPITKKLSVREWTCQKCGTHHDRDINAAKNILREGMEHGEIVNTKSESNREE